MIKEGLVLENNHGNLKILVDRNSACGSCAANGSCAERKSTVIEIFSQDNISKGDRVILESEASEITKLSAAVYAFPALMMILGAFIPNIFLKNTRIDINILTLLFVVVFLIISIMIVRILDKKYEQKSLMKVRKIC